MAPLGTALTPEQIALLWRMADEPILCFDGDKAGRRAAYRAIDIALPLLEPGKSLRFALLPDGQDPDDLARSGGQPALARVLDAALPLVDLLWMREIEAGPLDTPERRAALERRLREILSRRSGTRTCAAITGPRWTRGCARSCLPQGGGGGGQASAADGPAAARRRARHPRDAPRRADFRPEPLRASAASRAARCSRRRRRLRRARRSSC